MATNRKSNKVIFSLVGYFVLFLLVMQIILAARYKNGDIKVESMKANYDLYSFPGVRFVLVTGLSGVSAEPADSMRLEVEHGSSISKEQHGDTLLIGRVDNQQNPATPVWTNLQLKLPYEVTIITKQSEMKLHGSDDSTKPASWNITADHSKIEVVNIFHAGAANQHYFRQIELNLLQGSTVIFDPLMVIDRLDLIVQAGHFEENGAHINQITLNTDNSMESSVNLSGNSLGKLLKGESKSSTE